MDTTKLGDLKRWLPIMILGGGLLGGSAFWFHSRPYNSADLVQMLPPDRSSYVFLDVGLLRSAGVLDKLAGSAAIEDADYRKFVADTGFDYRKDLDKLAVAFRDGNVYYAAQGRFDWSKLAAYAPAHGGSCDRFQCITPGSEPGRDVSYYMPRNGDLAIAVSRNEKADDMVAPGTWQNRPVIGNVGAWISLAPTVLADLSNKVPAAARSFVQPLAQATSLIFTIGPGAKQDFELDMQLTAKDAAAATKLTKELSDLTDAINKAGSRPDDISGVLAGGHFTAKDAAIAGTWPVTRAFLDSLGSAIDLRK